MVHDKYSGKGFPQKKSLAQDVNLQKNKVLLDAHPYLVSPEFKRHLRCNIARPVYHLCLNQLKIQFPR